MVKVYFPNFFMRLLSLNTQASPAVAKLHVSPRMTKTEIKEYLTKIYNVDVQKVNTANLLGE
ncbi:50S ribosomal protein L23 [archaeon]|nr:MAG: 50S ribosomal protein L23 [archaeon]